MGKYLNDFDALPEGYVPPGWDEWDAYVKKDPLKDYYYGYTLNENGKTVQYGFEAKDYTTDVLRDKAVDFIKKNSDMPFFLMFTPYAPISHILRQTVIRTCSRPTIHFHPTTCQIISRRI